MKSLALPFVLAAAASAPPGPVAKQFLVALDAGDGAARRTLLDVRAAAARLGPLPPPRLAFDNGKEGS